MIPDQINDQSRMRTELDTYRHAQTDLMGLIQEEIKEKIKMMFKKKEDRTWEKNEGKPQDDIQRQPKGTNGLQRLGQGEFREGGLQIT